MMMSVKFTGLFALICAPVVWGGYFVTTVETDLVPGDCNSGNNAIELNHWFSGVSYYELPRGDVTLTVEYHGYTATCCIVDEPARGNAHPCSTPPPVCPTGFEEYDGQCYFYSVEKQNWEGAKAACEGMGATLARPTEAGNFFIVGSIQYSRNDFWIDLNNREGAMQFTDGTVPSIAPWAYNEPNNVSGTENCVEYDHDQGYQWNDRECSIESRYICQSSLASGVAA